AKVVVELPDGTKIETTADKEGNWTANVPAGKEPKENDVIKAVATVDGKTPSEEATATTTAATPVEQTAKPNITAPKAGDKTITGTSEPNAKVVVELPDGTKIETTADKEGNWTANVPAGKEPKENDVIKAVATVDGKTPSEEATATTTAADDKTKDPTINQPTEGDNKITGKGEPGSKIVVDLPDGTKIPGKVDDNGHWTVDVPADKPLKPGDVIKVTQTDDKGKVKEATATVASRFKPEPIPTPDYNPWWPIYFGSTKTEVKPEVKHLERHEAYIAGYPDGTVRPDGKITRAEVAAILARLTENSSLANFVARFSDVKAFDWFSDSIMKLSAKDIITGYPDGTFKPNKSITRAEFAAIVSKYIKNPKAADEVFADVPMNHWAKDAIAKVKAEGWISGYNDGTFRPDAPITRAEAVSIVNRMFDRAADGEFVRDHKFEVNNFKDLLVNHWAYYDMMEATHSHDYEKLGTRIERWEKIVK
ncbi:S-layer homology domain-containing protein, partial [Peptoniphilus duerdenii]|uniref:S-layer homology domain-containing protein n=1 Tax=Peptoniphilus duerdenii TaxID=507750 RepID=UPI00288AFB0D